LNKLFFKAVPNKAKKGNEKRYLPARTKNIIEIIEIKTIPNLNIPENFSLSILEISQSTPYKIRKTIKPIIIKFICETSTEIT